MFEALKHLDYSIFHLINHDWANPFLDAVCPWLRERLFWVPLYLILALYFFKTYGQKAVWLLVFAVLTIILCDQLSSSLIKPYFHRLRPCNNPALAASVRLVIKDCGVGYSFVSSHAANHFGLAAFISVIAGRKALTVPLLFIWAALVSFSQVYVGVHFPLDVIAGALLGILIGLPLGLLGRYKAADTKLMNPKLKFYSKV
jgi:membrane-associated phospholipid phosphatase